MEKELRLRPGLLVFIALLCGFITPVVWAAALPVALLLCLAFPENLRRAVLGCYLLGWLIAPSALIEITEAEHYDGPAHVLRMPRPAGEGRTWTLVQISVGRVMLSLPEDSELGLGDRLWVRGQIEPLTEGSHSYLSQLGVVGRIVPGLDGLNLVRQGPAVFRWGVRWRRSFQAFAEGTLSPPVAELLGAMTFSLRGNLDEPMDDALSRLGVAHLVAASGLHVVIFAFGMSVALRWLPIPRRAQILLLLVLLLLYAGAAGFRPPVVRAVLMAAVYFGAGLFRREPDGLSAIGWVGFGYLLWDPYAWREIGFQLSFATVLTLALYLPVHPLDERTPWRYALDWLGRVAQVSAFAFLGSLPFVVVHFGVIPLAAIAFNLLLVPFAPLVIMGGLVLHAIWLADPGVASMLAPGLEGLVGWFLAVMRTGSEWGWVAVEAPAPPVLFVIAYYVGLILMWRPRRRAAPLAT